MIASCIYIILMIFLFITNFRIKILAPVLLLQHKLSFLIAQNSHFDLFKCYTHQLTDTFSVFFDTPNDHKTNVFILFKELTNFCFSISQSPIVQLQNATEVTQLYHAGLWDMYINISNEN